MRSAYCLVAFFQGSTAAALPMAKEWKRYPRRDSGVLHDTSHNNCRWRSAVPGTSHGLERTILSRAATLTVIAPAPAQLNATPTSLNFGNAPIGTTVTRQIALATQGSSDIVFTKIGVAGPGFNVSGASTGLSQAPGQTTTLQATFAPASAGNVTGRIT